MVDSIELDFIVEKDQKFWRVSFIERDIDINDDQEIVFNHKI